MAANEPASAADQSVGTRFVIEQPAQPLGDSLRSIARQTGASLLFDPAIVQGRRSSQVSGRLSAAEAVSAALVGTGLTVDVMKDGALVVKPAARPPGPSGSAPVAVQALDPDRAASDAPASGPGGDGSGAMAVTSREAGVETLTRVEVTGSRLKRVQAEGPAQVNVYTRKDIDRSGQPNLGRFLAGLNEVSMSTGESTMNSYAAGQSTVQLRGLPLGSTLVLINGRRVQAVGSSSGQFFNLNLIPMAAVERIEVVPVGSSAVYGGDALAGVVNVILRKSIDGQSLMARAGSGRGLGDGALSLATGGRSGAGSFLLMGAYDRGSLLSTTEREFFKDGDYRRLGGTDTRVSLCSPGTVSSLTAANLPGLNSAVAGIPVNGSGQALKPSDFIATAGQPNLCSQPVNGVGMPLVPAHETLGLHALGEYELGGSWSAFAELTLADDRSSVQGGAVDLTATVPAANPYNPFGTAVKVQETLGIENGLGGSSRVSKFTRALVGVRGELFNHWEAELTASTTRDHGTNVDYNAVTNSSALAAALSATSPATALNPFTTGRAASDDLLRSIWRDKARDHAGRKDQVAGLLRGSLWQLPAGPLDAIIGAEVAWDHYDLSEPSLASEIHAGRRNSAGYGELRAPLMSVLGGGRGDWALLAVTVAARTDRYSGFGSANTSQAGVELRPARSLLIRASTADSFKPPTLPQTQPFEPYVYPAEWYGLSDPARGGEPITSGTVSIAANEKLGPERGRAKSLGVVWEPEGSLGTRLSLNRWQVRITDLIARLTQLQTFLDYEALLPGIITRGPAENGLPGRVTNIKWAEVNIGKVKTAGTDLEAAYSWQSRQGRWSVAAGATRTSEYRVALSPGAPEEDRVSRRFDNFWAPKWKGRLSLGLDQPSWSVALTSRYLGRYLDTGTSTRRLGDFWMHDVSASLNLKHLLPSWVGSFKAANLGMSVVNLGDREPQFVQAYPYFDSTQADWRGRYLSLRLALDW